MSDTPVRYANFPERETKVTIGQHISVNNAKLLSRLTIGTYEMSIVQQERIGTSGDAARQAVIMLAKEHGLQHAPEETRDCASCYTATGPDRQIKVWVNTPFESGQTTHLVWIKYSDLTAARKIGIAYKLSTAYTVDDFLALIKKAQEHVKELGLTDPVSITGNPPPRFQKKTPAADAPAASDADAKPAEPAAG